MALKAVYTTESGEGQFTEHGGTSERSTKSIGTQATALPPPPKNNKNREKTHLVFHHVRHIYHHVPQVEHVFEVDQKPWAGAGAEEHVVAWREGVRVRQRSHKHLDADQEVLRRDRRGC